MSGTSVDGVDCAIVDFANNQVIATKYQQYSAEFKTIIRTINNNISLQKIATIDNKIATIFANTIIDLLKIENINTKQIIAIGSHGHTIYHHGRKYSWQIGDANIIAKKTNITVVSDFRRADIALGGEGAPLTPKYHAYLLKNNDGIIINLGGIANITKIKNNKIIGFDSGPANTLIDNYMFEHTGITFDKNGDFAKSGIIINELLQKLLADKYFAITDIKSTGVEYFNLTWLNKFLKNKYKKQDIIRTLVELTALTISYHINNDVYLCGGGVHNLFLVERLKILNKKYKILTTNDLGVNVDFVEAVAFAYFAKLRLENKTANIPSVTGATNTTTLGAIYNSE